MNENNKKNERIEKVRTGGKRLQKFGGIIKKNEYVSFRSLKRMELEI